MLRLKLNNMIFQNKLLPISFKHWLRDDKENYLLFFLSAIVMVISFVWLKILYPYPNFMPPDSYNYLEAASTNEFISIWPIGYSKFLRAVSCFSNSHVVLVIIQFLLLHVSVLYFLFSLRYLLSPGIWLFRFIAIITISNPLLTHISNYVSSDCVFISISAVWLTQLLWIICKPNKYLMVVHAVVILLAFMMRHYALYYPLISILAILSTRIEITMKWISIGSIVCLLSIFIGSTQHEYNKTTNKPQYTAFAGWQIAANALYGYAHVSALDSPSSLPRKFRALHTQVNQHMKYLSHFPDFVRPDSKVGVYYLWDFNSPLIKYREKIWKFDSSISYFKKWASMAPLYSGYGRYIIKHHPISFTRYFILPNLVNYFSPPPGFLGYYNLGKDTVDQIAVTWFGLESNKIPTASNYKEIRLSRYFSIGFAIVNILFIFSFIAFVALNGFKNIAYASKRIINLTALFWCSNLFFSVISAPNELRYQLFPMIIIFSFSCLLIDFIIAKCRGIKEGSINYSSAASIVTY